MFKRKSLERIVQEADGNAHGFRRALGAVNLVSLGIGVIVGAGCRVRDLLRLQPPAQPDSARGARPSFHASEIALPVQLPLASRKWLMV